MLVVDKNTFKTEVLENEGYVLVDFFGDGCEPCAALMPKVEALSEKVLGLPVIAIYKDGVKVEEVVKDDATEENIEAMIKKYL